VKGERQKLKQKKRRKRRKGNKEKEKPWELSQHESPPRIPPSGVQQQPATLTARPLAPSGGFTLPPEILSHLLREEIRRSGVENLDGDLLKCLLMSDLASSTNKKIEAGPALSLVLNQLWLQTTSSAFSGRFQFPPLVGGAH
jgi:hypothetical protein